MLSYPLDLSFKIVTIGSRIRIKDATGRQVAYVRKKKLELKEDVRVYEDENQSRLLLRRKADRMLDFSARYAISGPDGHPIGAVGRRGMKSLWSSAYVLVDSSHPEQFTRSAERRKYYERTRRIFTIAPWLARIGIIRLVDRDPAPHGLPHQHRAQVELFNSSTQQFATAAE